MRGVPLQWKERGIILAGIGVSVFMAASAVQGDWSPLILAVAAVLCVILLVKTNYPVYLSFGVLAPFFLPIGLLQQFPTYGAVFGVCVAAAFMRRAVSSSSSLRYLRSYDALTLVFHAYLIARYLVDPALPGHALGLSQDITGFRSWFDHLLNLGTLLFLGVLIYDRQKLCSLAMWLAVWSGAFTAVFVALMFVPGTTLSLQLAEMGMYVTFFANGWRRFVFLPSFGILLVLASLLPNLFRIRGVWRFLACALGLFAVAAGGNRSSLAGLLIILCAFGFVKRKYVSLLILSGVVLSSVMAVELSYEMGILKQEAPFVRVFGAFSSRISEDTGGTGSWEWRLVRWNRAIEDIKAHPVFGMGYGGARGFFRLMSDVGPESSDLGVEADLATGTTHNGYLSAARALGIPAVCLFVVIMVRGIWRHLRRAWFGGDAVMTEVHLFVGVNLLMNFVMLLVSAEIRMPIIWFYIALGILADRMDAGAEPAAARPDQKG